MSFFFQSRAVNDADALFSSSLFPHKIKLLFLLLVLLGLLLARLALLGVGEAGHVSYWDRGRRRRLREKDGNGSML